MVTSTSLEFGGQSTSGVALTAPISGDEQQVLGGNTVKLLRPPVPEVSTGKGEPATGVKAAVRCYMERADRVTCYVR